MVFAAGTEGSWGVGLRLGPSIYVQKLSDETQGEAGPLFNGTVTYGLTNRFSAGLHIEWEKHTITNNASDFIYGEETTISIIPVMEFHPGPRGPLLPYGLLGVGINLNSFKESNDLSATCSPCRMEPKDTLALKGGIGIDYFATPDMVYNAEFDLKMNDGKSDVIGNIPGFPAEPSTDNSACALSLIFGVRHYY